MYKLKPIRRRSRKIGRNEPCPCGRTKEVLERADQQVPIAVEDGHVINAVEFTVPLEYKHCCGKIENQRMMAAVRRHISQTIYNAMHGPKKASKLRKIINLFKKDKK